MMANVTLQANRGALGGAPLACQGAKAARQVRVSAFPASPGGLPDPRKSGPRTPLSGDRHLNSEGLPPPNAVSERYSITDRYSSDLRLTRPRFEESERHAMEGPVDDLNCYDLRKTKIVCTIGPTSNTAEMINKLGFLGMNVARLNMSHGDHASHQEVVDLIKKHNQDFHNNVALLLDTKGPEVRSGEVAQPIQMTKDEIYHFTIMEGADGQDGRISVNYDGFIDDVSVGDELLVDGGLITFKVLSKTDVEVEVQVVDGGEMGGRRHLNVKGKSANLPALTEKDVADIEFGIANDVDYYALSFVRTAEVVYELKDLLKRNRSKALVLVKIESADSIDNLDSILDACDGAMVARGDLGAEMPLSAVPFLQSQIIQGCRKRGKPVIVATNMLESMIVHPTPTRAEVSDIAIAVRDGTDAIMLSGETAYGAFPLKAVETMHSVAQRTEKAMRSYQGIRRMGTENVAPIDWIVPPDRRSQGPAKQQAFMAEMFAFHAVTMANTVTSAVLVFTRKGNMPKLLSHYRPDYPIFVFTEDPKIQRTLAVYNSLYPICIKFGESAEETFDESIRLLRKRGLVTPGESVAIVQSGRRPIWRTASTHSITVRMVPDDPFSSDDDDMDMPLPLGP